MPDPSGPPPLTDANLSRYLQDRRLFCAEQRAESLNGEERLFGELHAGGRDSWQVRQMALLREPGIQYLFCVGPRGASKTSDVAWLALEELIFGAPGRRIDIGAADEAQGRLILDAARRYLSRNPQLGRLVTVTKNSLTVGESKAEVLAADAASSWGRDPDLLLLDELTAWVSDNHRTFFDSMWTALGKRKNGRVIIISNAGIAGSWQHDLWRQFEAKEAETKTWPSSRWRAVNLGGIAPSWADKRKRESDLAILHPLVAARLYRAEWVSEVGAFISAEAYDACVDPTLKPATAGRPGTSYVIGCDLGLVRDRTAVCVLSRDDSGGAILNELTVFQGSKGEPVSLERVEDFLRDTCKRYGNTRIVIDPWESRLMGERLSRDVPVTAFSFTAENVKKLTSALFTALSSRRLKLFPDPALREEFLALQLRQMPYGERLDHRAGGFSDRAISIGMALTELTHDRRCEVYSITSGGRYIVLEDSGVTVYADSLADARRVDEFDFHITCSPGGRPHLSIRKKGSRYPAAVHPFTVSENA